MKMYAIKLDIGYWILAEVGVEATFGQKTACPNMSILFKYSQKNYRFNIWKGFGCDLEHPNIWLFEHLDREMSYGSHLLPTLFLFYTTFCKKVKKS